MMVVIWPRSDGDDYGDGGDGTMIMMVVIWPRSDGDGYDDDDDDYGDGGDGNAQEVNCIDPNLQI